MFIFPLTNNFMGLLYFYYILIPMRYRNTRRPLFKEHRVLVLPSMNVRLVNVWFFYPYNPLYRRYNRRRLTDNFLCRGPSSFIPITRCFLGYVMNNFPFFTIRRTQNTRRNCNSLRNVFMISIFHLTRPFNERILEARTLLRRYISTRLNSRYLLTLTILRGRTRIINVVTSTTRLRKSTIRPYGRGTGRERRRGRRFRRMERPICNRRKRRNGSNNRRINGRSARIMRNN